MFPPTSAIQKKLWHRFLDLIYPPCCAICQEKLAEGRAICEPCETDLPRIQAPFCQSCGESFTGRIDEDFSCPNCSNLRFSFEFARPALLRDARTLDMIHRLKYGREIHLAEDLGRLAAGALRDPRFASARAEKWPLVPVPLHRNRHQLRHFNQAAEIARGLSINSGLPIVHALKRTRSTEHQTSLTRAKRLENLRDAFALTRAGKRSVLQKQKGVVLVDDVFTTGSTVDECAKVLRRSGFTNVYVITVMRG
jgi:competence protein ComFC